MESQGNSFLIYVTKDSAFSEIKILSIFDKLNKIYSVDQFIHVFPSLAQNLWRIRFWNCDGSEALACGNGTRCAAHLLYRLAEAPTDNTFEGPVGTLRTCIKSYTEHTARVAVLQGNGRALPIDQVQSMFSLEEWCYLTSNSKEIYGVDMGNKHIILHTDSPPLYFVHTYHSLFGVSRLAKVKSQNISEEYAINISYVEYLDPTTARIATWEHGVGPTLACGSAASAAFIGRGKQLFNIKLLFPGGQIDVRYDRGVWHTASSHVVSNIV